MSSMGSGLSIRRYQQSDLDRVRELHEIAMREVGAFIEGAPDPDLQDIEGAYLDADGEFLVGEIGGEVVAMGAFRPATGYITEFLDGISGNAAEIKRMRVAPEHQKNGYGTQIFAELQERAQERDYTELVLDTGPTQEAAKRLYEANGFEEQSREQIEIEDQIFSLIFYRKNIEG
jgi:ribosomal protein S18 acetylase RimI-like enzyme